MVFNYFTDIYPCPKKYIQEKSQVFWYCIEKLNNMKKNLTILLLILTCNAIFSQNSSIISIDYNRYFNNQEIYQRTNGISIAYEYEWKVKEYLYLKGGIQIKATQEIYHYYLMSYNIITDPITGEISFADLELRENESNGIVFGIQFPFNMKTNLYNSKLFLLTGINIGLENFLTFTEFAGTDPEISSGQQYPRDRKIGFGYNVGLLYEVTPRLGLFGEFVSTQNSDFSYNYVGLGMKIKIGKI